MKFNSLKRQIDILLLLPRWLLAVVFTLQASAVALELVTAMFVASQVSGQASFLSDIILRYIAPNMLTTVVIGTIAVAFFVRLTALHLEKQTAQSYRAILTKETIAGYGRRDFKSLLIRDHSEMSKSLTSEMDLMVSYSVESMISIGGAILSLIILIVALCIYNLTTTVITFGVIALYFFTASYLTHKTQKRFGDSVEKAIQQRQRNAQELFFDIRKFKISGEPTEIVEDLEHINHTITQSITRSNTLGQFPRMSLESALVILVLYGSQKSSDGLAQMSGDLIVFGLAALRILPIVQKIYLAISNLVFGEKLTIHFHDIIFGSGAKEASTTKLGFFETLRMQDVAYLTYDEKNRIQVPDFSISRGEIVAIVGPSGTGKTTFVDVLAGLHIPLTGEAFIDDSPLDQTANKYLNFGYVTQKASLRSGTVANLLRRSGYDDAEMARAMNMFELQEIPLDHVIGENARNLSGGQTQRLNLLQSIGAADHIKIFDESFNAIDPSQRMRVFDAMRALAPDLTGIVITHDPDISKRCDRVYRFKGNQLVTVDK